eukprot:403354518
MLSHQNQRNSNINQNRLPLYIDDNLISEYLDLKEVDPIFSTSYEMMIKEAFRADKNFIIAKMKTRSLQSKDQQSLTSSHSHFFNVHGIMKLLFKKKGTEIVGRFHSKNPIQSKNPLTNQQIIGEVEFYIVRNPYLSIPIENRYPVGQTLSLEGVKGEFSGTDFNYLYSDELRLMIDDNCLEHNKTLLQFEAYQEQNQEWSLLMDGRGDSADAQFQNDIQEIVQTSFLHSEQFYFNGGLSCVYFLAGVSTFLSGISLFFNKQESTKYSYDHWTIILPIAAIVYDCDMRRVYRRQEKYLFLLIKLLIWGLFYALIGLCSQSPSSQLLKFGNLAQVVIPILAILYSFFLGRINYFSFSINQQQNQYDRFEVIINSRQQAVENRQNNFDEHNFGGEEVLVIEMDQINNMNSNSQLNIQQHQNIQAQLQHIPVEDRVDSEKPLEQSMQMQQQLEGRRRRSTLQNYNMNDSQPHLNL